ncbi:MULTISPECIES: DUF3515 domain-containing protein [Microbacterium]|jgi:Protein of unknown function (DUF3515)|uniref:DUF3515 domain-containing protein n=1 Tax=Microbacterium paraoxydans TaxID=199592 RepID=A0A1H1LM15_9MICO|nr:MULTISPECIES: DUF3515 domain-containing protein [Microbacterium]AMG84394.1 hypothetical protein AXH82_14040 [Microbacterium sp. PAMC 28756]MCT1394224.1 DUF3515 domain-containing protein [Microbacterium sp. p3-SID338]MCT2224601.1 DUF3515 domain-containing protein [Microbacterium paraoxydans]PMC03280.1 DUF3515 domain-containing protein [Microbacterium sp. UMB0228]QXE31294.1 DUF3515 domain-containing protein [Microbacterium paraoxydans]
MLRSRRLAAVAGAIALAAGLAGCSTTVHLEPAADANDPACANVSVLLPDTVGGYERVWTDAQATGAWGDPTVVLRCGVEPPAPSDLVCTTLGGVDWLVLEQEEERQRLVTYGREPAIEVIIRRGEQVDFQSIVDSLSSNIQSGLAPATAQCTDRVEFPAS